METKVKIIERVDQGEKMVNIDHSYKMNYSNIDTILKNKYKITEHVQSAVVMMSTIILEKREQSDGDGETSQCLDAASASSPTQLNADSRES